MSKNVTIPDLVGNWSWVPRALSERDRSQADLAAAWGVDKASVTRFVRGRESEDPRISRLLVLARMLGLSVDEILLRAGIVSRGEGGAVVVPAATTRRPALPGRPAVEMAQLADGRVRLTLSAVVTPLRAAELVTLASSDPTRGG